MYLGRESGGIAVKMNGPWWSKWQWDAAGIAMLAVLSLTAYFAGFRPLLAGHEEWAARRAALAAQREQAAKLQKALTAAQGRLEETRAALAKLPLRLQPASNVIAQLAAVSALANEAGLRIDDIHPERGVPGTHYETVPIQIVGSGTYTKCTRFVSRLCKVLPDTNVSSLEMGTNPADLMGAGTFRFGLCWYTAPAPK